MYVTVTSQGQITLPAAVRRSLQIMPSQKLVVSFDAETKEIRLKKNLTIDEFEQKFADIRTHVQQQHIKPITDVDTYYQTHRTGRPT